MKKIMYLCSILFVSLLMMGCQDKKDDQKPLDVNVTILNETVINHHIHIDVLVPFFTPLDMDEEATVHQLMNELANEMYMDYFEEIDGRLFYLYLHGYDTQQAYDESDAPFYGTFVYGINLNVSRPGLSFVRVE